jgi:hypothetical protein
MTFHKACVQAVRYMIYADNPVSFARKKRKKTQRDLVLAKSYSLFFFFLKRDTMSQILTLPACTLSLISHARHTLD